MSGRFILLLLVFTGALTANGQQLYYEWGKKLVYNDPVAATSTHAREIIIDEDNHLKVLITTAEGSKIATYSPTFELLAEINLPAIATEFVMTEEGDFIVSGPLLDTVDFDPGSDDYTLSPEGTDHFLARYDANGNFAWAHRFEVDWQYHFLLADLVQDAQGNIFLGGSFSDTADFDPGPGVHELVPYGHRDMFVMKVAPDGNLIWVNHYGTSKAPFDGGPDWDEDERLMSISLDAEGNPIITGNFIDSTNFDPSGAAPVLATVNGGLGSFFIARINSDGSLNWVKTLGFFGSLHFFTSHAIADQENNVVVTFYDNLTLDVDPGPDVVNMTAHSMLGDCYLLKLDADGNYLWAKHFGKTMESQGYWLETDAANNIYLLGGYRGEISFENDSILFESDLPENPNYYLQTDYFFSSFSEDGQLSWLHRISGKSHEYMREFVLDDAGNLYTFGSFSGTVNLNPDFFGDTLVSEAEPSWQNNSFVMKLGSMVGDTEQHMGWLYPNPNNGQFMIEVYQPCDLRVYSLNGDLLFSEDDVQPQKFNAELTSLEGGLYIIQLVNDSGMETFRFVKY